MSIQYHHQRWLNQLHCDAIRCRHRHALWLSGSSAWRNHWRVELQSAYACARVLILNTTQVDTAEARRLLGQEFDLVVLEGRELPSPDLLAIVTGALAGGGMLVFDLVEGATWPGNFDRWLHQQLIHSAEVLVLAEGQPLPRLNMPTPATGAPAPLASDALGCLGDEQRRAVDALLQVVHGHRRRPLVLTAERGRGKSSALGIAAAVLLTEGRSSILVTAPKRAAIDTLLSRAADLLPDARVEKNRLRWQQGEIRFLPPDQLLREHPPADLLLVDEAAAIPAPLLSQLLEAYARIVFATTTRGYEGTGRGFDVRFRAVLDQRTPGWRALTLTQPIRWAANDPLERWLYRTLLLDAEAHDFEGAAPLSLSADAVECWQGAALLAEPELLRQLFALLVLAHYQTSPNDLRDMIQGEGMRVWLLRHGGQVAGAMLTVAEGPLDPALVTDIWLGQRRPPGHLLPQALVAHSGWLEAGSLRYQRVVRIAVHPQLQRQGLGQVLLEALERSPHGADLLGSSFAASDHLPAFWQCAGFQPVRLGLRRDAASGAQSLLVVRPLSGPAQALVAQIAMRFWQQLEGQLAGAYREVDATLLSALLAMRPASIAPLSAQDARELVAYVLGGRGFEQSEPVLRPLLLQQLAAGGGSLAERALLIRRILQRHSVADCCAQAGLTGRRQLEAELRRLLLPAVREQAFPRLSVDLQQRVGPLLDS